MKAKIENINSVAKQSIDLVDIEVHRIPSQKKTCENCKNFSREAERCFLFHCNNYSSWQPKTK